MRVRLLEDFQNGTQVLPHGSEHSVRSEIGNRWVIQGKAVEILGNGRVRRRRGRPKKEQGEAVATSESETMPTQQTESDVAQPPKNYLRGDVKAES